VVGGLLLVEHHGPEEVYRRVGVPVEMFGELPREVLPERLPLPLLVPHVLALEQRDLEPALRLEDGEERDGVGLHEGSVAE
jgi:hypothetical protein